MQVLDWRSVPRGFVVAWWEAVDTELLFLFISPRRDWLHCILFHHVPRSQPGSLVRTCCTCFLCASGGCWKNTSLIYGDRFQNSLTHRLTRREHEGASRGLVKFCISSECWYMGGFIVWEVISLYIYDACTFLYLCYIWESHIYMDSADYLWYFQITCKSKNLCGYFHSYQNKMRIWKLIG